MINYLNYFLIHPNGLKEKTKTKKTKNLAYLYIAFACFIITSIATAQVTIGSNVSIAPNVVIVGMNHVFSNLDDTIKSQGSTSKGIIFEDDVWIATNVSILDGITIGKGTVIAAGAVVNKDVPPYSVMAGVPAKVVKQRNG